MPSLYAHYYFGKKCIDKLPKDYKDIVLNNISYFYYGTQTPNLFYYSNIFSKTNEYEYHNVPMYVLIKRFKENISNINNRDKYIALIYGYISHFLLDSYCHTYIDKVETLKSVNHYELESNFDKYLLIKNKKSKIKINRILNKNNDVVKIISIFLNNKKENLIKDGIENFKTINFLLYTNNQFIKKLTTELLKLFKKDEYINLIMPDKINKNYLAYLLRLDKYLEIASLHFSKLINNFMNYLMNDEPLLDYYNKDLNEDKSINIDILSLEDEKKYIINKFLE